MLQESDLELAEAILALLKDEGYVKLAKDQSLPYDRNPRYSPDWLKNISHANLSYREAQKDMWDAGFRKVLTVEEIKP